MKILIIEDDSTLAETILLSFRKEGILAEHAITGEEALVYLTSYSFDLILLDVLLPDMSGFDLLKTIRQNEIITPVLILSGLADSDNKIEGLSLGADDYLSKPFDKNELLARVKAIIRRSKGFSSSILKIGELEINLDNKQVVANSQLVHLTNKEYTILEILCLKKGKTVSKEHLLDQLYGGIDEPEPKIIDVFVCKLRKKIEKVTKKNYIGTIWGQGYMINDI
jgi:two-component system cell cycle response regulator CtrA